MKAIALAGALLALAAGAAAAQEPKPPRIVPAAIDWDAASAALASLDGRDAAAADRLQRLNAASRAQFPDIETSPIPVLLPFDAGPALSDPAQAAAAPSGYRSTFFYPGPAGYDAEFSVRSADAPDLADIRFPDPIPVLISGSALLYELDPPAQPIGAEVVELKSEFPGIRRFIHESHLRYTFVRFGVPYAVSIACFDGPLRARRVSCKQADRVASHFIKSLRVAGGRPAPRAGPVDAPPVERPQHLSTVFTYHSAGDLIPGTGFKGHDGRADTTVYARIRFPLADAPAYANSQSFMNWGDCNLTGRVPGAPKAKGQTYRCRLNGKPLVFDESAAENYAYPWRDNFCEHRHFFVGQCPGGQGHQGQDIRPAHCSLRNDGADRCEPYEHNVVAVREGAILRTPGREAVYLVINTPAERMRFRYMHMSPEKSDAANLVSGRRVQEGEIIGKVGNYNRREGGTSYHLHFDLQVPTRNGWVFVNPYMTLVTAYERLIQGRGVEIKPSIAEDIALAAPAEIAPDKTDEGVKKPRPKAKGKKAAQAKRKRRH